MNWYDRHLLPYLIDIACGLPMVQKQRRQLVPQAQGRVLEIGMGTGRNLPFYDRSRITRISEVVGSKPKFGLTDAMALQNDPTSPMARRAVALLQGLAGRDANERGALALLGNWNGHEGPDSAAAALYEIWAARHLAASAVKAIVPPA